MSRKLVELLHKERLLTDAQLQEADQLLRTGTDAIRYFLDNKTITESKLVVFLSQKFSLQSLNLSKFEIKPEIINMITPELVRKTQAIPIQMGKGILVVAIPDPTQMNVLDDIRFATKMSVEPVLTSYSSFDQAITKYYGGTQGFGKALDQFRKDASTQVKKSEEIQLMDQFQVHEVNTMGGAEDAPVINVVNGILSEAVKRGASDIHIEPYEKDFRVRFRIDGSLVDITHIPSEMKRAVVARFKIMSRMDIAEQRLPQDGRIKIKLNAREIDFRVNTLPTLFGEKVVLRILSKGNLQLDLKKLGFEDHQLDLFRNGIEKPSGMVLVTGPTGSGKTTTLYSALMELNKTSDNLSTVEDPVEYNLEGINQVQVNKDVGLTFASVLRALLRQDPDTVLVGEIRDLETAEVAVQAALTGHLVLSTLHTNDTVATITRLVNMGVEPFLVTASVNLIVAQRLLRKLCLECKQTVEVPEHQLFALGIREMASGAMFYEAKGCNSCSNTGYKGRVAVYEVLDFNSSIKEMVLKERTAIEIRKEAVAKYKLQTLRLSALKKAIEGITSLDEAISMTNED